jgi:hypothetical protein
MIEDRCAEEQSKLSSLSGLLPALEGAEAINADCQIMRT